jgi:flavorubredoxin
MLERISAIVDPAKIDYIVSNHVEMDHSGGLPRLMEMLPKATIITSPKGQEGLKQHYKKDWNFKVVQSGDTVNIGKRDLTYVLTPMVHWPDNMVCYSAKDKILFSNDAFGQHLATSERFDDEYHMDIITEEAMKYYANIVLPYSAQVQKALADLKGLAIDVIAPSHGILWRKNITGIIENYRKWSSNETDDKALIIYDTMWKSTEKVAFAIQNAFENKNIFARMFNLQHNHISDIMTEVLTAKYICVGSSTLNKNMLPTVAAFLTYFKGLAPKGRKGLAFGSYGWAPFGVKQVDEALQSCKFEMMEIVQVQYVPDPSILKDITAKVESQIS